jgi:hypothetical protein
MSSPEVLVNNLAGDIQDIAPREIEIEKVRPNIKK